MAEDVKKTLQVLIWEITVGYEQLYEKSYLMPHLYSHQSLNMFESCFVSI